MMKVENSLEQLKTAVAELLGVSAADVPSDANLIELGFDSISMMRLTGRWQLEGIEVDFAQLAERPTVAAWHQLRTSLRRPSSPTDEGGQAVDEFEPFDLAVMQHAYWVGRGTGQQLGGVAAHFYNEFDGTNVDPNRLEAAIRRLIARHGMLRVRVLNDGRQQILADEPWEGLQVHDLRELEVTAAKERLTELRSTLSKRSLNLAEGQVFDIQLSLLPRELGKQATRLHLNIDMFAVDALSVRVLLADLARLYAGPKSEIPEIDYSYPRYRAERKLAAQRPRALAAARKDRDYWLARLDELPGAPQLPIVPNSSPVVTEVKRRHHWISAGQVEVFTKRARHCGLTPAMALAALFAEVLTAWSEEPRFLLNLPMFGREPLHPDVDRILGDFTSSILVAWDGAVSGSFAERAQTLQRRFHQDARHAGFTGVEVLRELSRARGQQVLAPVVYTSALGLGELYAPAVKSQFGSPSWIVSQGPQVWLDIQVTEFDGGLLFNLDAREALFPDGVLDGLFRAHIGQLNRLLSDETAWRRPLPQLLPDAQASCRAEVNATQTPRPSACIHTEIFQHGRVQAGAEALLWGSDNCLTYGELCSQSLAIAAYLHGLGIAPGEPVGVHLPRGPEQIVAVLGILAAGAAYVPIGLEQPRLRRERIIAAGGVNTLISSTGSDTWPSGVTVCNFAEILATTPLEAPRGSEPEQLAYIIFTSGSTGEPKGVEITHDAAWNTIADIRSRFEIGPEDRTLAVSALDFDLSVFDIFGLLSAGGAVVLINEDGRRDAEHWLDQMARHGVTVWNSVPTLLEMLLAQVGDEPGLIDLRLALVSGDWVPLNLPHRLRQCTPNCRFVALGGATEVSIWSNFQEVDEVPASWPSIPYGRPLSNQRFRVVDGLGRDCPDWVAGELWIGGRGVALGYRNDEARTEAKFPLLDGERWYRTGDRGRYWPDGTIEFLGRIDAQIKRRGHRIELGEIEATLAEFAGVRRVAVSMAEHGLVAALVLDCSGQSKLTTLAELPDELAELPAFLAERLPNYMVPDAVWICAALPLSANGKVDRKALRDQIQRLGAPKQSESRPPVGEAEQDVADAWAALLGAVELGQDSDFFVLGGDSLLATRLVQRLRAEGYVDVKLADVFAQPKLSHFAAGLSRTKPKSEETLLKTEPERRHEPFPPTQVQRAYWLGREENFVLGGVSCHFYREYEFDTLDVPRLERALNRLIAQHEMLRVVFDEEGQQRVQKTTPRFAIEVVETGDFEAGCARLRKDLGHRRFDPTSWPLFALRAVRSKGRTRLGICLDNLILDALSVVRFYTELGELYDEPHRELEPITMSFRDFVQSHSPHPTRKAAAEAYWADRLSTLPPGPQLPLAKQPHEVTRPRFIRYEASVESSDWQRIRGRAANHGLTASVVLLATFTEVLGRWCASPELTVNLTVFDRPEVHPDIYRVMGDFTSLTLIESRPEAGESWLRHARRVQDAVVGALEHREMSSIDLMRQLARNAPADEALMPVVFTSALGVPGGTDALDRGIFSQPVAGLSETPQVWLDHQVVEQGGGVVVNWDAVDELFPTGMVAAMFAAYESALAWLAAHEWDQPLPDLMPAEQREVRCRVNATSVDLPKHRLHEPFFRHASSQPQRTALKWGERGCLSYGELAASALRVTAALVEKGVRPGELVVVNLPKGPAQIAATLGILAAGGAYLPVGIDQPIERRTRILAKSGARIVVTEVEQGWPRGVQPLLFPATRSYAPASPVVDGGEDLAYVIFTSGSTGEPKGVEMTHHAAVNTIADIHRRFEVGPDDSVLAVSAMDFDLSVYDVFGMLGAGGCVVLLDEESRRDPRAWHELAERHGVTVWNSVPTILDMALEVSSEDRPLAPLRLVLVSGDWVGLDLPGRVFAQRPDCRFVALGGATEAAIWSNFQEVQGVDGRWRSIPYGRPLANQSFRVVDPHGRDCPDWVPGELWIGGLGVARGYRAAPELTANKFVGTAERWYRTGDLGRYWPDGTLEFLGRTDTQVKLGGHRVELGEIEAVLNQLQGVEQAIVVVVGMRLEAVVCVRATAEGEDLAGDCERSQLWTSYLRQRLPTHMLPQRIETVSKLPLTANGKVDRSAIIRHLKSAHPEDGENSEFETPRGPWEPRVAELWSELLDVQQIGRQHSFFQLGGDSLLATRFTEQLKRRFGVKLGLRQLFGAPKLHEVAAALAVASPGGSQGHGAEFDEGVI